MPGSSGRVVALVEEGRLVVAESDPVAGVLAPEVADAVVVEVGEHSVVDVRAGLRGSERVEGGLLRRDGVAVQPALLVGGLADDHAALELGVVAPDRRSGLGDEHVAGLEGDVVRDGVGPGGAAADLAAVAGGRAVLGAELAGVVGAERLSIARVAS